MCVVSGLLYASGAGALTGGLSSFAGGLLDFGLFTKGVTKTYSAFREITAKREQALYSAEVAEANAQLSARYAERIDLTADQRRRALLMETQQARGSARAGYASGGVVLASGTHLDYEADIAQTYDIDLKSLDYDVANQKWQAQVQAWNDSAQGKLFRMQASEYNRQRNVAVLSGAIDTVGDAAKTGMSLALALRAG